MDAVRVKTIRPVHPTVAPRPRRSAVERVDVVPVVERHLVLTERLEVVVQSGAGHGVEEARCEYKRKGVRGLVPLPKNSYRRWGWWGGGRGKGERLSPHGVMERSCHRDQ